MQSESYVRGCSQHKIHAGLSRQVQRLVFGGGHNGILPARNFFALLAVVSSLSDCLIYIRCLNTKATLLWNLDADSLHAKQQVTQHLLRLDGTINHRVDICLSITTLDSISMLRRSAANQLARDLQTRAQLYSIFSFTQACNLQSVVAEHEFISHINMYTAILTNVRSFGRLPTDKCSAVAHKLLTGIGADVGELACHLDFNATTIADMALLFQQMQDTSVAIRCELSTTWSQLTVAAEYLCNFCLEEDGTVLREDRFICYDLQVVFDYVQAILLWISTKTIHFARELRTHRKLNQLQVGYLALLEDLGFQSFLYGQTFSESSRLARRRGAGFFSDLAFYSEFDQQDRTRADILTSIPRRLASVPYHLTTLAVQMIDGYNSQLPLDDCASNLALLVVVCLNADLCKTTLRRKFASIDMGCGFLQRVRPGGLVEVGVCNRPDDAVRLLQRIFLIYHDVKHTTYQKLHNLALQL